MSKRYAWLILFASLLAAAAGWIFTRPRSDHRVALAPARETATPVSITQTVATATVGDKPSLKPVCAPILSDVQPSPSKEDLAITNAGSPYISADLDENREWARKFPDAAAAWLRAAQESDQKIAIAETVCPEIAETNPVAAVTLAEYSLGNSTNKAAQYLVENMVAQWADKDLAAATAWALARPTDAQRDQFIERIAFAESKNNPYQAAQLTVKDISPGETQNEAAMAVLNQWAQQDAASAMAWAETFPQGAFRDRAIAEVRNFTAVPNVQ